MKEYNLIIGFVEFMALMSDAVIFDGSHGYRGPMESKAKKTSWTEKICISTSHVNYWDLTSVVSMGTEV